MDTRQIPAATGRWPRIVGLILLLVPIGALAWAGLSEVAGGDATGLQHIVEIIPLAALAALAWFRPRLGGPLLVGIGLVLALVYAGFAFQNLERGPVWLWLLVGLVLFAPVLLAGGLFWAAARRAASA